MEYQNSIFYEMNEAEAKRHACNLLAQTEEGNRSEEVLSKLLAIHVKFIASPQDLFHQIIGARANMIADIDGVAKLIEEVKTFAHPQRSRA